MTTATTTPTDGDDPIRADVEQWLRAVLDATLTVPLGALRDVDTCLRRRVRATKERIVQPVVLARSLIEAMTGAFGGNQSARRIVDTDVAPVEHPPPVPSSVVTPSDLADGGAADDLPIEEYESLAASHVVARLERLSPADLRTIRRFETAHRGRRTVLGKIDQLLGPA